MTSWTPINKNSSSFSTIQKSGGNIIFLLKEDSGYLLLEDNGQIILEGSGGGSISWANITKS